MDWFRSWHGAPTDNKWLVIAKRAGVAPMMVSATFWALLDYASQQNERGSIAGFDVETYALWAGVEEADILAVLDAMRAKGVITDGDTLAAWDKRQPKREDDSAERVRRHRERQKADVTDDNSDTVTQCNADVTQGNAPDKIQNRLDTESDAENTCTPDGVAHEAPVSTSTGKSKRQRSPAQQEMDLWIDALAYALGFDPKIPGAYQKWARLAKGYADAGYTHSDVENWRDYVWPNDWRYQKGQPPTKAALDAGLPELKRKREVLSKPKQTGYITDPRTGERIEVQL